MSTDNDEFMTPGETADMIEAVMGGMDEMVSRAGYLVWHEALSEEQMENCVRCFLFLRDNMTGEIADLFQAINMGATTTVGLMIAGAFTETEDADQALVDLGVFNRSYNYIRERWMKALWDFTAELRKQAT